MNRIHIHWIHTILSAGVALLFATSVQAAGFGAYLEYAPAGGYIEEGVVENDYDTNRLGVGFALDTNVARDRMFNYRLNLGYQRSWRDYDLDLLGKETYNGFTMNHTFGFALYTSPSVRVWAGPAIRFSTDVMHESDPTVSVVNVSFGGGPQVGVNLHTGERVSVAFSAAYQYLYVGQVISYDEDYWGDIDSDTHDGAQHLGSLNVTFFFRTASDRYESRARRRR